MLSFRFKKQTNTNVADTTFKVAIKWFHENKMMLNLDKFQAIVLDECRSSNTEIKFIFGLEQIQAVPSPSVDILGITIDDKLKFAH